MKASTILIGAAIAVGGAYAVGAFGDGGGDGDTTSPSAGGGGAPVFIERATSLPVKKSTSDDDGGTDYSLTYATSDGTAETESLSSAPTSHRRSVAVETKELKKNRARAEESGSSGYARTSFGEVYFGSEGEVVGGTDVVGRQSLTAEGAASKLKKEIERDEPLSPYEKTANTILMSR